MLRLEHLPNEVPAEKVIHVLRRHPFTMLSTILGYIFILALPFAAERFFSLVHPEWLMNPIYQPLIMLGVGIVFLVGWLMLFLNFLDYYLDIWIVTNKRILNIEQTGLFSRTVSEVRLHRVQDVTSSIKGFWATMFDFGQLDVQTAGEKLVIVFEEIPHPTRISKTILELSENERRSQLDEAVEEFAMPAPSTKTPS